MHQTWFLNRNHRSQRQWNDISKVLKAKNSQPIMNIYTQWIHYLKKESKIKTFSHRQKLRKSNATRSALQAKLFLKFISKQGINGSFLKLVMCMHKKFTANVLSGEFWILVRLKPGQKCLISPFLDSIVLQVLISAIRQTETKGKRYVERKN